MSNITPTRTNIPGVGIRLTWETLTEADTAVAAEINDQGGILGAGQVIGAIGGATLAFQASNDGSNWWNLKDTSGTEVGLTAVGGFDFSTAARFIRPSASGGSSQDLDIIVVLR